MYKGHIAGARLNELKSKTDVDNPGLFSQTSRIVVVSSIDDVNKSATFEDVVEALSKQPKDITMWVDFQGIDEEDMKKVEHMFKLHPLTIEDCVLPDTREKYEVFEDYYFLVFNELHYIEYSNILNNVNLCMVVFPKLVLSFHAAPLQTMHEVVHKLSFERTIPDADWLLYTLMDGVVDIYVALVDQIVREADSLDDLVLLLSGVDQTELLERIGYAHRHSGFLKSGLWSKREILTALLANDHISSHTRLYLQNVADHLVRCDQKLKLARQTLGTLNSAYLAKVSIELADASNRMNVVMRRLGALSAIFLPLTLIAGIMGMNVRVPGMIDQPDTPDGYGWFIGVTLFMTALAVLVALLFKWKRWL